MEQQILNKEYLQKIYPKNGVHSQELIDKNIDDLINSKKIFDKLNENIIIIQHDICELKVDAIVNSAQETLTGGGGIDGHIHKKCGPELLQEIIAKIPQNAEQVRCNCGDAKLTNSYNITPKYIIHTVGPYLDINNNPQPDLLKNCYINCMKLLKEKKLQSIAFPSISTGFYGYPLKQAVELSLKTITEILENEEYKDMIVIFCSYDQITHLYYLIQSGYQPNKDKEQIYFN